jgi:hypothetical protein
VFGRGDDSEAELVEGVLFGGHLLVGLFVVVGLGKLGAEEIAFGIQCGEFVAQCDRGPWSWCLWGLECR